MFQRAQKPSPGGRNCFCVHGEPSRDRSSRRCRPPSHGVILSLSTPRGERCQRPLARAEERRIPGAAQRTASLFQGPPVPGRCQRPCPEAAAPRGRAGAGAPALTGAILRGPPSPARDVTPHTLRRMTSPRPASHRRRL